MVLMRTLITAALLLVLLAIPMCAQDVPYFPNVAIEEDWRNHDLTVNWYTTQLRALKEPSLLALSNTRAHAYRFLWLRSFHNPVAVRLSVGDDGTSLLTVKVANGKGGYEPGVLVKNETRTLSKKQTHWFLKQVRKYNFWDLPPHQPMDGVVIVDGAEWVLEAVKDGRYKVVARTSPKKGPVRALGLAMLIGLGDLKIPADELY